MAKILLQCHSKIGTSMAGPAIRYWEFARLLSKNHDVTLSTPSASISSDRFKIVNENSNIARDISAFDIVITQMISHKTAWRAKKANVKLILDAYDPMPLENLEIFKTMPLSYRYAKNERIIARTNFSFKMADGVLAASMRQKDLWTGLMLSLKCIKPEIYDRDNNLNHMIKIVPFGLNVAPPERLNNSLSDSKTKSLRETFKISLSHKVILWGGGIWNWFDPLTLIEALNIISKKRQDIHLVFMGLGKVPDKTAEMVMANKAVHLAKELNLFGKMVHFNFNWVPYDQRTEFLLDADIGISTHFNHLETRFAFRTRILDYLWAGLPIIATTGDSFADVINQNKIGLTVPSNDSKALSEAILTLVDSPDITDKMKANIQITKPQFYWENVIKPLEEMIDELLLSPPKKHFSDFKAILSSLYKLNSPRALFQELKSQILLKKKN